MQTKIREKIIKQVEGNLKKKRVKNWRGTKRGKKWDCIHLQLTMEL